MLFAKQVVRMRSHINRNPGGRVERIPQHPVEISNCQTTVKNRGITAGLIDHEDAFFVGEGFIPIFTRKPIVFRSPDLAKPVHETENIVRRRGIPPHPADGLTCLQGGQQIRRAARIVVDPLGIRDDPIDRAARARADGADEGIFQKQ